MKIGLTGYPLTQLTGGESLKKTGSAAKKGSAERVDVPVLSSVPDKAIVRYLRTVDEVLSDIIRMVDDDMSPPGSEEAAAISEKAPQQASITPRDAAIYLPPPEAGAGEGSGGLIIIKDVLSSVVKDMQGQRGESVVIDFAKGIAGELSRIDAVIVAGAVDLDSPVVKDKYIISVDAGGGIPVSSVIRHDPSGTTVSYGNAAEGIDDAATASAVARIASFITRRTDDVFSADTLNASEGSLINSGEGKQAVDYAAIPAKAGLDAGTFVLPDDFDPVKAARDVASFLSAWKGPVRSEKAQAGKGYDMAEVSAQRTPAEGTFLSDEFPGVTVRVIPSTILAFSAAKTVGMESRKEAIAERFAVLADTMSEFAAYTGNTGEGSEEDLARLEAARVSVKGAVKESLQTASGGIPAGQAPASNELPEGIGIDEEGMLRVDRKVLAGTLMEKKDEAAHFIRGFGNALHDRITYFFHPFAGLYAADTGTAAAVRGAGNKEGIADEEEDVKVKFEKKLNEIRMLLESSYQLKEAFTGMGSSGGTGEGDGVK